MKSLGAEDLDPKRLKLPPVVQHTADANRRNRRALIKAIGHRQFKKIYRKTT